MKTMSWWVLGSLLVSTSLALAQAPDPEPVPEPAAPEPTPVPEPAPPPPPPPMASTPAPPPPGAPVTTPELQSVGPVLLPNLLSTNTGTTVDVTFDYVDLDGVEDVYLFALRAHVQHITPQGMGGYVILPGAAIDGDNVDSDVQLGNVEVGGLYHARTSPTFEALLRGGVSIDTQGDPEDGESIDSYLLNVLAHFLPRPTDAYTHGGLNTTWGRVQAQFVQTSNNIRFGGMIGFDLPIAGDVEEAGSLDLLINGALSAGYQDPKFGIAAGFTFIQSVSEGDDEDIKGVQLMGNMAINPATRAYLQIGLSMDGDEFLDGTAFGFGVRAAL